LISREAKDKAQEELGKQAKEMVEIEESMKLQEEQLLEKNLEKEVMEKMIEDYKVKCRLDLEERDLKKAELEYEISFLENELVNQENVFSEHRVAVT